MRKFTKVVLIIAGILFSVGVICTIAAFAMGLSWERFSGIAGEHGIYIPQDDESGDVKIDLDKDGQGTIIGQKEQEEKIDSSFQDLEIEFDAGTLTIQYADVQEVQIKHDGINHVRNRVKENTLYIVAKNNIPINNGEGKLTILLPKDKMLREVDLEIGAGIAQIEKLVAASLEINVGAGKAKLTEIDVKEFDAQTGAGELYVQLVGAETDYSYEAECGIGELTIGAMSVGGLGGHKEYANPTAKRHLELECGIGEMKIEFQK